MKVVQRPAPGAEESGAGESMDPTNGTLAWLGQGPVPEVAAALRRCCASETWVQRMLEARPFDDFASLLQTAEIIWWELEEADWLEAFAGHPRIGDLEGLRSRFAATRSWAAGEQAGVDTAGEEVLQALAAANRRYEQTFGYLFIVCASGKSAEEMLGILEQRLASLPGDELRTAAAEQRKITELRLQKLVAPEPGETDSRS